MSEFSDSLNKPSSDNETMLPKVPRKALAVWDSRLIRSPLEIERCVADFYKAETEAEREKAEWKIKLIQMEDEALLEARMDPSLTLRQRHLADDEYTFRASQAALEDAKERNQNLSIRERICNASRAGAFDAPARLVFEYIRSNKKRSPSGFYEWCRSLAEIETLTLRGCEVIIPKSTIKRRLGEVEIEVTLENTNGELLDDGIVVEGLGKFSSGSKQYSKRTLIRTYERYQKSRIF